MRALAFALLAVAAPALAQSSADTSASVELPAAEQAAEAPVDSALVGEWRLSSVVEGGRLDDYGVDIQAMTCSFSSDGRARVSMMAVQDGESMSRQRAFEFDAAGGVLTEENGHTVRYRVLDDGQLEVHDGEMVIRLVRADA